MDLTNVKSCLSKVEFPVDKNSLVKYTNKHCKSEKETTEKLEEKQFSSLKEVVNDLKVK